MPTDFRSSNKDKNKPLDIHTQTRSKHTHTPTHTHTHTQTRTQHRVSKIGNRPRREVRWRREVGLKLKACE